MPIPSFDVEAPTVDPRRM